MKGRADMQLVMSIQSAEDFDLLDSPWGSSRLTDVESQTVRAVREAVTAMAAVHAPNRVYFGSEFCHYRLVDEKTLLAAYERVREAGYAFSFAAPYLPQAGLERFLKLLSVLAEQLQETDRSDTTDKSSAVDQASAVEVIVNDWGVLHLIRSRYPQFTPVLGRLLNKMIRDPRATPHYNRSGAPVQGNAALKQASFTHDHFRRYIREAGVKMMELDHTVQGIEWVTPADELGLSVHLGFGSVATGRSCLVGSLHVEEREKFRGHIVCKQQCRHYTAEMQNRHPRIAELPQRLFQKGNSVFYQQTRDQIKAAIEFALAHQAKRLVYSPRIPV